MNTILKRLLENNSGAGPSIADSSYHTDASTLDPVSREDSLLFKKGVLEHKNHKTIKPIAFDESGASPKSFFRVAGGRDELGRVRPSPLFMIKPYHENLGAWGDKQNYPLAGWAEMAWIKLLHAANLGHMAMSAHTFHYKDSSQNPLLAVKIEKNAKRIGEVDDEFGDMVHIPDHIRDDAAKLATMDFLFNNQDRHSSNLLYIPGEIEPDQEFPSIDKLIAIDNGRSMQFLQRNRFVYDRKFGTDDHPLFYFLSPGYSMFGFHKNLGGPMDAVSVWWKKNRPKIRSTFHKELKSIKQVALNNHMRKSFEDRVKAVDGMVHIAKTVGINAFAHYIKSKTTIRAEDKKYLSKLRVPIRNHDPSKHMDPEYLDPDLDEMGVESEI